MKEGSLQPPLAALGHRTRLAIVEALATAGSSGRLPSELADDLGIPRNLLSAHILVLERTGLVAAEQRGRNRVLRLNAVELLRVSGMLAEIAQRGDVQPG